MKINKTRRALMKDLGSLALTPLWSSLAASLLPGNALAQASNSDLNLLLISFPHGLIQGNWEPQRLPDGTFTLANSPVLAPLEMFKNRINIFTGLGHENLKPDGSLQSKFAHGGLASSFTGSANAEDQGGSPSIDYLVSEKLYGKDNDKVLRLGGFLSYGPEGGLDNNVKSRICYAGPDAIHKRNVFAKPRDAFDKAFESFVPVGGGAAADQQKLEKDRLQKNLLRQLERIEKRLAGDEKAMIRIHQQTLTTAANSVASFTCETRPNVNFGAFQARNEDVAALIRCQMDVAIAALRCGGSRVVTLEMLSHSHGNYNMKRVIESDALSAGGGPVSDMLNTNNFHNDVAHRVGITGSQGDPIKPDVQQAFHQAQRFFMVQLAYLLQSMQTAGILDKTLVMVGTEMGSPMHLGDAAPFFLMGGGFRMGRWFQYKTEKRSDYQHICEPHNRLLVSVAQRFGLQVETFGDTRFRGGLGTDTLMQRLESV